MVWKSKLKANMAFRRKVGGARVTPSQPTRRIFVAKNANLNQVGEEKEQMLSIKKRKSNF
jgi:hypothetical protein